MLGNFLGCFWVQYKLPLSEFFGILLALSASTSLALKFGCKEDSWPASYLGLPLNGKPKTSAFWAPIVKKIEKRFCSWNHSLKEAGSHIYPSNVGKPPNILLVSISHSFKSVGSIERSF